MAYFHPINQRSPKPHPDLVARISKLSTISRCLEDSLSELIRDENVVIGDTTSSGMMTPNTKDSITGDGIRTSVIDKDSDNSRQMNPASITSDPVLCEDFKTKIMKRYGEATAEIDWDDREVTTTQYKDDLNPKSLSTSSVNVSATDLANPQRNQAIKRRGTDIARPPAAILRGTVSYYNRIGGQWRIVVSNGEIRRRVNLHRKGRWMRMNEKSLWEQTDGGAFDSIKFDDPILILAYDDL